MNIDAPNTSLDRRADSVYSACSCETKLNVIAAPGQLRRHALIRADPSAMFKKLLFRHGVTLAFLLGSKVLIILKYREGDRTLLAFRERLVSDPAMDIDSDSIASWEPPFDKEPLVEGMKRVILENICQAADVLGITYVIR